MDLNISYLLRQLKTKELWDSISRDWKRITEFTGQSRNEDNGHVSWDYNNLWLTLLGMLMLIDPEMESSLNGKSSSLMWSDCAFLWVFLLGHNASFNPVSSPSVFSMLTVWRRFIFLANTKISSALCERYVNHNKKHNNLFSHKTNKKWIWKTYANQGIVQLLAHSMLLIVVIRSLLGPALTVFPSFELNSVCKNDFNNNKICY